MYVLPLTNFFFGTRRCPQGRLDDKHDGLLLCLRGHSVASFDSYHSTRNGLLLRYTGASGISQRQVCVRNTVIEDVV